MGENAKRDVNQIVFFLLFLLFFPRFFSVKSKTANIILFAISSTGYNEIIWNCF